MAASIAAERAETALGIIDKKVGGVAYIISGSCEAKKILESSLREACSMLEAAEELLHPQGTRRRKNAPNVAPTCESDIENFGANVDEHDFSEAARQVSFTARR